MRNLVVGVDGSPAALNALTWAAETVGPTGEIHAVSARSPTTSLEAAPAGAPREARVRMLQGALENCWIGPVRRDVATVTARADDGHAVEALTAEVDAYRADAIVVGAHLPALGVPHTIGRTIRRLLQNLPCPLIVVPVGHHRHLRDGDPIIVGVGHGEATEAAVRWAAMVAESHGLPLGLVRATGEGPVFQVDGLLDWVALYIDPAKRLEWAREDVTEFARTAQQATESEIDVAASTVPGLPATQLAHASQAASLLVIGQHLPLIQRLDHVVQPLRFALTHAHCPVAVVPVDMAPGRLDPED